MRTVLAVPLKQPGSAAKAHLQPSQHPSCFLHIVPVLLRSITVNRQHWTPLWWERCSQKILTLRRWKLTRACPSRSSGEPGGEVSGA